MPRVNYVKKARKDNPVAKKGESYYWWKFRYGPKHFSKVRPRQSQLTQSDKLTRLYSSLEAVEDFNIENSKDLETFAQEIRDRAEEIREVAEEYRESAQNIEDGFGHSTSKSDELNERGDEVESFADSWDSTADEIEAIEFDDTIEDENERLDTAREEALSLASDLEVY